MIAPTVEEGGRRDGARGFLAEYSRSVVCNSLGYYDHALVAAQRAVEYDDFGLHGWALTELVEAGTRANQQGVAVDALRRLSQMTQRCATEWALGIEARSRALVSDGPDADALYRESIDRLGRTGRVFHLARSELLYGEWLRRDNRRVDARNELRTALAMFEAMDAPAFTERARRELLATGETARKRRVETFGELTAQEWQIAQLAGRRLTNSEIATKLFISPHTVEWHLRKVFTKLGVSSRKQLGVIPAVV